MTPTGGALGSRRAIRVFRVTLVVVAICIQSEGQPKQAQMHRSFTSTAPGMMHSRSLTPLCCRSSTLLHAFPHTGLAPTYRGIQGDREGQEDLLMGRRKMRTKHALRFNTPATLHQVWQPRTTHRDSLETAASKAQPQKEGDDRKLESMPHDEDEPRGCKRARPTVIALLAWVACKQERARAFDISPYVPTIHQPKFKPPPPIIDKTGLVRESSA